MTIEDALNSIDQALSTIQTNRANHVALQQAIQVVRDKINSKDSPKTKNVKKG